MAAEPWDSLDPGWPLVALMPLSPEFDEEADAARPLPVLRYTFDEDLVLDGPPSAPCRAIHRGFILSQGRYCQFFEASARQGVHLAVSPEQLLRANYWPNSYPAIASMSPKAVWAEVPDPSAVCEADFQPAVDALREAGVRDVFLKDFVKSAKDTSSRFARVRVDGYLAEVAVDFVAERGVRFHRGVVFKEWVCFTMYACRGGACTNEWRLWFGNGELLSAVPNSFQEESAERPPADVLQRAQEAAVAVSCPYMTIDVAETEGGWIAVEVGAGPFCGPGPCQDLAEHWRQLAACLGRP
mmetsp:Transcript_80046/g.226535  ORF Transcript_80046/g.226535 Transcript_80046/m.226535 type:complete len:298 (+) Transcript_80046:84-977(+)